jgi:hypothetical protein
MPFSTPVQQGVQLGTAPIQDWTQQHEMYRNALADSIRDNAETHQRIADRFTSQIAELRDSQSELRGRLSQSHDFALSSNAQLGNQLGELASITSERLGNVFGALAELRDRPTAHHNYYQADNRAIDARSIDARSINMMNNRSEDAPNPVGDAGDVFEDATDRTTRDFMEHELAANAQGSTATAAPPFASQEAAIMTNHGNRIGTVPTLSLPTSTRGAEAGDGTVRIRSFGERVSESRAAPRGDPQIENGFGEGVTTLVIAEPQPIVQRAATDLSMLQQAQAGIKRGRSVASSPALIEPLPSSPLLQSILQGGGTGMPASMIRAINEQSHIASAQNALVAVSRNQNPVDILSYFDNDDPPVDRLTTERPVSVPLEDNRKKIAAQPRSLSPLRKPPVEERSVVPRKKLVTRKVEVGKSKKNT